MKPIKHLLAASLLIFATSAFAQKPMDQASEKSVKIVNGPTVTNNTGSTATLTWTTDREGANHVQYRPAGSNGAWKSAYHSGGGNNHTLQLTGLNAGQTYEYQILTRDGDVRTSGQFQAGSGNSTATNTTNTTGAPTDTTTAGNNSSISNSDKVVLYRSVGPNGVHVFSPTSNMQPGFTNEGIAGYILNSQKGGTVPLYRLTNAAGDTLLTTDQNERASAQQQGYTDAGVMGYIAKNPWGGTNQPLYRLANSNSHFYTTSAPEKASAQQQGYRDEGTVGYIWSQQ